MRRKFTAKSASDCSIATPTENENTLLRNSETFTMGSALNFASQAMNDANSAADAARNTYTY